MFLNECERVCKEKIIITTPNGYLKQALKLVEEEVYQKHESAWFARDFRKRGYNVHGLGFRIPKMVIFLPNPIAYRFPQFGRLLVAIKSVGTTPHC